MVLRIYILLASAVFALPASAETRCVKWNNVPCVAADFTNAQNRQVVVFGAGYTAADADLFWGDFDGVVSQMVGTAAGTSFARQKKERWLFIGEFRAGETLASNKAWFNAKVMAHPSRGSFLTIDYDPVYARCDALKTTYPGLKPFTAGVMYNTPDGEPTANATPPSFIGKPYGIAKFTRQDARNGWTATHEFGHSGMDFLDEYVEAGLEDINIRLIDVLSPLLLLNASWSGIMDAIGSLTTVYDIDLSEILAANGNDNLALSRFPATVTPLSYEAYDYEGGSMFGRGTWHVKGASLMNGFQNLRGPDDHLEMRHTQAQQRVVDTMYSGIPGRANNRLRNAGPITGWPLALGTKTKVLMYDADKNHHFQKTQRYTVQVGWNEREWKTCWAWFIPYPCSKDVWKTAEKTITPTKRTLSFKMSFAYGLGNLTQKLICFLGLGELNLNGASVQLCAVDLATLSTSFLPTVDFMTPYQETEVPASQWMTTYYWRFKTDNGSQQSGYTGWSSFFRSF